jgi:CRISPR-associated protein Cas2
MARRRYLVAYDIREERRLRNVATCMEGYGERIQYSVFVCDLSDEEAVIMRGDLELRMKPTEDSVMIIDLGRAGDSSRFFLFLGHHAKLPTSSPVVI